MGKSFHRRSRHGFRPNKNQRQRERRRIRIRNRKVHDELKFTKFIKTKHPDILNKDTFMTQISCPTTLDEVTSEVMLELGNLQKHSFSNKMVNEMTMTERVNECINIIEQLTLAYDMTNDFVALLRYLAACKKRLMRRGNLGVFAGHTEHVKSASPKNHGRPPLHPNSTPMWSKNKQDHVCMDKDIDDKLGEFDSDEFTDTHDATLDQSVSGSVDVKQNGELETESPDEGDVPICIAMSKDVDEAKKDDVSDNQDNSWSCSIM